MPNPSQYAIPLTLPDVVEGEETENGEVEREERGEWQREVSYWLYVTATQLFRMPAAKMTFAVLF